MALDPTKNPDWKIAEEAETRMKTIHEIGKELGLTEEELLPQGHYFGKIDFRKVLKRLKDRPNGKYIDVTAITPTPLGEGKSIRCSLDEMVCILHVLKRKGDSWSTYHKYKENNTQISFSWEDSQKKKLWINIESYSKMNKDTIQEAIRNAA